MRRGVCVVLAIVIISSSAYAQFDTATVLGTVKDSSSASIPGVSVKIENRETGITSETTTDSFGNYQFINIRIGTYRLTAELAGFSTAVADNALVTVNARQRVDLNLQVGPVTESIQVTDAVSLIESDSSDRGQVINSYQVVALPLNGRSYSSLALLSPGVRESTINASREGSFNVNGLRSTFNNFVGIPRWHIAHARRQRTARVRRREHA